VLSRRESDDSRGAARAFQQGEDAVCQGCRIEFQHRDISGHESNREAPVRSLRARGIKPHAYRRPVLPGGTDQTAYKIDKIRTRVLGEAFGNIKCAGEVTVRTLNLGCQQVT